MKDEDPFSGGNTARPEMRFTLPILCSIAAALSAAPVNAEENIFDSGLYFSFAGGISDGTFFSNDWLGTDPVSGGTTDFAFDYSLVATGAAGYSWQPLGSAAGFRVEIEGSYRRSEVDHLIDNSGPTLLTADGYLESIGAMANGYVDFNVGENVTPYFGAGVGAARVSRRDFEVNGAPQSNKYIYTGAWQVMAGVGYKLSPGMIIGVEFRRFELNEFRFDNTPLNQEVHFGEMLITFRLVG